MATQSVSSSRPVSLAQVPVTLENGRCECLAGQRLKGKKKGHAKSVMQASRYAVQEVNNRGLKTEAFQSIFKDLFCKAEWRRRIFTSANGGLSALAKRFAENLRPNQRRRTELRRNQPPRRPMTLWSKSQGLLTSDRNI